MTNGGSGDVDIYVKRDDYPTYDTVYLEIQDKLIIFQEKQL